MYQVVLSFYKPDEELLDFRDAHGGRHTYELTAMVLRAGERKLWQAKKRAIKLCMSMLELDIGDLGAARRAELDLIIQRALRDPKDLDRLNWLRGEHARYSLAPYT